MHTDWEKDFFKDIALDMWNRAMTEEQTLAEAEFLEKALALPNAGAVLDVPCGGGRHSIALARKGYRVRGIDLSEEYVAQASAAAGLLAASFAPGDMRKLEFANEFDGALCFGNSFCYLNRTQAAAFVQSIARALKTGGRFAMETGMAAESILPTRVKSRWFQLGDLYMLSQNTYNARESCMDIEYTFIRDGKAEVRPSTSYVLTVNEICSMHEAAGLEPVSLLASIAGEPFELGSPRLILVSEKRTAPNSPPD